MTLISKPTKDPKVTRWWWRTLRTWVYTLVDPLWEAFRGENSGDIAFTNVTGINGISATELGTLDGLTATTAELNRLSGLTADAAELNKADRTQADGRAEPSRNLVLDANQDIVGIRYLISRTLLETLANKPYLHLDGASDSVLVADDANIQFGTGDFAFMIVFRSSGKTEAQVFFSKRASGGVEAYLKTDGSLLFYLSDGTNSYVVTTTDTGFDDGEIHVVVGVADRDTELAISIGGIPRSFTATGALANVGNVSQSGTDLCLGSKPNGTDYEFSGQIFMARLFNRALTVQERVAYSAGAVLEYADIGANQTDKVTNGEDWTGASGSTAPNSWTEGGAGTANYIIRDNTPVENFEDDKTLEMSVSGNSKTLSQSLALAGKRYRVSFVYRNLNGSSSSYVALGSSSNNVNLQSAPISGDGIVFEQDMVSDGTDLSFFVDSGGILQIDHVKVVQIGCVADWSPEGISAVQWQDKSGNELHGMVNGAVPVNLPVNHRALFSKKGITGDSTLGGVIPAGYRISSIIIQETAGNAITGGLKIGSSAGGTDVVNGQAVGANALVDCALGSRLFSLTAAQSLYVEDVTAWNGASIDLYLEIEKI
ncbi:MAG: LamG-like jellyroll fold domain-containing protein [Candidatus Neomarinimicrobiota bacterium]